LDERVTLIRNPFDIDIDIYKWQYAQNLPGKSNILKSTITPIIEWLHSGGHQHHHIFLSLRSPHLSHPDRHDMKTAMVIFAGLGKFLKSGHP
jgi:hypothetical protein